MDAIKARIKETGKFIEGYLDGKGHFDVPVDHCEFERYNVNDLDIEIPRKPIVLTWEYIDMLQDIMNEVHSEFNCGISAEGFGNEVIERFYQRIN